MEAVRIEVAWADRESARGSLRRILDTGETGGLVAAARALVAGELRVGTERPRPVDLPIGAVRRDQLVRRLPVFHPLLDGADGVKLVRPRAAAAV